MFTAVRDIPLSDNEKKYVDRAESLLIGGDAALDKELVAVRDDVVAGLLAGSIDVAKIQARYAAMDKAMASQHEREAAALDALFSGMTPANRKKLVEAVRAKQSEQDAKIAAAAPPRLNDAGAAARQQRRLEQMTRDLGLDAAQQKQVATVLAKSPPPDMAKIDAHHIELKKKLEAVLTAFEKDDFSAPKLDLAMLSPAQSHAAMDQEVQLFAQLAPILKQDQREKLAGELKKRGRFARGAMRSDAP
jgi:hypothetical protein